MLALVHCGMYLGSENGVKGGLRGRGLPMSDWWRALHFGGSHFLSPNDQGVVFWLSKSVHAVKYGEYNCEKYETTRLRKLWIIIIML